MDNLNEAQEKRLESLNTLSYTYKYIEKAIKRYREEHKIYQTDLCKKIGLSQGFYSRLENCDDLMQNPNIFQIVKICNALGVSVNYILSMASDILAEDKIEADPYWEKVKEVLYYHATSAKAEPVFSKEENYAAKSDMERHFERLRVFANKNYIALYRHLSTPAKTDTSILHIFTGDANPQGYCPFEMYINGNSGVRYSGKIVSPPNNYFAYFYIVGGDPIERGMWIVYYPTFMSQDYKCGSGLMLSIDRNEHGPVSQRIFLCDEELYKKRWKDETVREYVVSLLDKQCFEQELMRLSYSDMQKEHKNLYNFFTKHASNGSAD